ncbi:hypothetical protein BDB00DRAFT_334405 [Zychaea mexicana]|uniref:uncharacterized protein n=1 Tax=Zychaea mexicana TaxID=64656 RepID=UPI0022FDFF7C|nr:uncharacterized protein BDB00DRAFT_334405 [Zychaea mexicana]KAI9494114.1 hypothetical protein BDB00DRAFT_334405 [Zychaea mexicana]
MDDATTPTDPFLNLAEWTRAIVNVDLERVQQLYQSCPDLLWCSLVKDATHVDTEHAHLLAQLERSEVLGPDLGDMPAIPYMLLDHLETTDDDETATLSIAQQKRSRLLSYLIQHTTEADLNTRSWGSCNNKTLHLAAFLGQNQIVKQLTERGASPTVTNDLGCTPKDIAIDPPVAVQEQQQQQQQKIRNNDNKAAQQKLKSSYSPSERFQQLRAMATEQSASDSKKQGSQEDLRQQTRRQQDLSLLAKRSAVKNNPLFKKFEQTEQQSSKPQPRKKSSLPVATTGSSSSSSSSNSNSGSNSNLLVPGNNNNDENGIRRNSKVINSLMTKSFVSSSVFRQGELERPSSRASSRGSSPVPASPTSSRAASPAPPVSPSLPPSIPAAAATTTKATDDSPAVKRASLDTALKSTTDIEPPSPVPASSHEKFIEASVIEEAPPAVDEEATTIPSVRENDVSELPLSPATKGAEKTEPIPEETEADHDTLSPEKDAQSETIDMLNQQQRRLSEHLTQAEGDESRRWSGSQRSHWSVGVNSWDNVLNRESKEVRMSVQSEAGSEQWFDSNEEWYEEGGKRYSLRPKPRSADPENQVERSPLRKSMLAMQVTVDDVDDESDGIVAGDVHTTARENNDDQLPKDATDKSDKGIEPVRSSSSSLQQEQEQHDDDDTSNASNETMTLQSVHQSAPSAPALSLEEQQSGDANSVDEASIESREPSASFSPQQRRSLGAESVDTWPPPPTSPPRLNRPSIDNVKDIKDIDNYELNRQNVVQQQDTTLDDDLQTTDETTVVYDHYDQQQQKQKQQQQMTDENLVTFDNRRQDERHKQLQRESMLVGENYGSVSVGTTSRYVSHRLQPEQPPSDEYDDFLTGRPQSVKLELPAVETSPGQSTSAFGKLYVRVSAAEDLLLPLPKETTYARCVVSDGHFEYMSRYEALGQKVAFDYECIVDAQPNMIITVSLHVRPDVHVRPKTGLTKWLTSARKQRETINGYVHFDDGSIGQSRFALGHMIQACNQKSYVASFDCFNSWYARSSKERQRQLRGEEDVLKVVGSLNVEMLYLPVSDPSLPIPRSLRECDLALRIRQWHQTCWHSGYLSTRKESSQVNTEENDG